MKSSLCAAFLIPLYLVATEPPEGFLVHASEAIAAAGEATSSRFPDADRVLVDNHVLEAYEPDGSSIHWDDEYSKVLTEKGRRDASSFEFFFDMHYGTAMVCRAEIVKPDGRVIPIDTAAYSRVMTETGQMGANIYDPSNKILSFSLPGLEIGDVYHLLTCQITTKPRMPDTWSDYTLFEYDVPVIKLDYAISAPAARPILHKALRATVTNTVTYTAALQPDGRTLHTWQVRDVPQMFPEPDMPPTHTQVQRLLLSTIKDWPTVSRWYWELCQPALAKTTPEMKQVVERLTEGAASRDEKIRRIFKFVSQEIRYMGITAEAVAPGYEPHDVSLTFNNRYGVCRDKAALLTALLRLADIPAYPVLINASAKMDPDVPIPYFNHAITAVDKPGGGYQLMDPTDENTRDLFPAYLCNRSYLVARSEGETLRVSDVYPAEKNLAKIASQGTLDENGTLLLTTKIQFGGINDNAYRGYFLRQKEDQRRTFFEAVLKRNLPGAEVLACAIKPDDLQDTEKPLEVTLTTRVPDFPVRGEGLDLVSMPWLGTGIGYANFVIGQTGLEHRRFALETGITCGIEETIALETGDVLGAPHALPPDVRINRGGVVFTMTQTAAGGKLTGHLSYLLKQPEFSPAEYLELKQTLREIEAAGRRRPLFVARDVRAPDHAWLKNETETTLADTHTWTTTRSWSKRILTYAGKKKNAELKINYNPAWQRVELVSATVSNVNGAVRAAASNEVNVMDAPWAGSAPRYPAGKTLVVTLPGVETGSVICVTTRFTQSNACFYSHCETFGGTEPSAEESYGLTFPKGFSPAVKTFHSENVAFTAVTNASQVTWTWRLDHPPTVRLEEKLPPWHFYQPTLFVSFGDWSAAAKTFRRAFDQAGEEDRAACRHAKALVKGIRDPYARLQAIRDDVLRTIRLSGPSFLDLPLGTLSSPDRTLADQYGHAADRALLLAAMLDAAGFAPRLVLASDDTTGYAPRSQPAREVPQAGFFQNPLVAVACKGVTYYLNDGDQYSELGTTTADRAPALDLESGTIRVIAADPPYRSAVENVWTLDLDTHGTARIAVTNLFFGPDVGVFRKQYEEMLPEDRRRHTLELVSAVAQSARPASDLVTDTTAYPGLRAYTVVAENYAVIDGDTLTLQIPEAGAAIFPLRSDTRENPLFLDSNGVSDLTCLITLPPGYTRLPVLPASRQWTLPNGLGTLDYRVATETAPDGRLRVRLTRRLVRTSGEAAPELYPALLEYNRRLTHPSARTLVAERGKAR